MMGGTSPQEPANIDNAYFTTHICENQVVVMIRTRLLQCIAITRLLRLACKTPHVHDGMSPTGLGAGEAGSMARNRTSLHVSLGVRCSCGRW